MERTLLSFITYVLRTVVYLMLPIYTGFVTQPHL